MYQNLLRTFFLKASKNPTHRWFLSSGILSNSLILIVIQDFQTLKCQEKKNWFHVSLTPLNQTNQAFSLNLFNLFFYLHAFITQGTFTANSNFIYHSLLTFVVPRPVACSSSPHVPKLNSPVNVGDVFLPTATLTIYFFL